MALSAAALTTVDNLRDYLSQQRTAETAGRLSDPLLEALIERVSGAIEAHCDRQLICPAADQTFRFDGDGGRFIYLPEYPIVSVTSITLRVNSLVVPAQSIPAGIGYVLTDDRRRRGEIEMIGYSTESGPDTVQVLARCGYDTTIATGSSTKATPLGRYHHRALADLENACLQWAALLFQAPIPSAETVTTDALAFTVRERDIPARVEKLLAPYRRWSI